MQEFSPVAAAERATGSTNRDDRTAAAERAAAAAWPSATEEIWRYSRIEDLSLDAFTPAAVATTIECPGAEHYVTRGGADGPVPAVVDDPAPDLFAELNAAFSDPVVVVVPANTVVAQPIVITHHVEGESVAGFPRLIVDVGENSEVVVVERFTSGEGVVIAPVLQLRAARAARVKYLGVNELADTAWQLGHQQSRGDVDSTTTLATVALGGHYARVRTEARLVGRGASTKQVALYFAGGAQMHDFRTIQDHDAPNTSSDLLFKGAVQDSSASVYTGLIRIRPHARGTVAFQTNRNLTLGAHAWAESVPNLEIETNDVKCSHASTVGPIDPEHRFYLESRGVPPHVADRLIVLGFFDEVLARLPVPAIAAELRDVVADKLDLDQLPAGLAP